MDFQLADKVVFVTGASGGIGRAIATAFAGERARLVLHGHSQKDELERFVADQPWRERALCVRADVTDPSAIDRAFDAARERFGRVDVVCANAGVWPPAHELLHEASIERIRRTLETNLFGATWTARAFFRTLAATGPRDDGHGACLAFTGSTAGRFGEKHHADYAASKAGLLGLVRTLKNEIVELDPYGRVNMVEPGWTVTHMVRDELERDGAITGAVRTMPLRQLARAADIARTLLYLSSPALARHVSGEVITVAGGMEGRVQWGRDAVDEGAVRRRLAED